MGFSAWSEETARTYLEKLSNHQRRAMQAQSTLAEVPKKQSPAPAMPGGGMGGMDY